MSARLDRRGFLRLGAAAIGGGALLGLRALPALGAQRHGRARAGADRRGEAVEILMRSDRTGARVWFEPVGVLVRPGQLVRWVNESGVHTATAYHPDNGRPLRMPADAEPWDSGYLVEPGATFELSPRVSGVYDFFCRPHEAAGMVGRLVVLGPDGAAPGEPGYPAASADGRLPDGAAAAFPSVREILVARPGP